MSDSIRVIKKTCGISGWVGRHLGHILKTRNAYKICVDSQRKKKFGTTRHRWKDNIRWALTEMLCEGIN
jgi:hypothetical protein